tara:strand:+ start:337 stop:621 length:285 start_codon:yes stop_codon:yes gene_type:complete
MSENQNNSENKNKELGALWKRKTRDGNQTYLAGHLVSEDEFGEETKTPVVVFSNTKKSNEKQPDFRIYLKRVQSEEATNQSSKSEVKNTEEEVL